MLFFDLSIADFAEFSVLWNPWCIRFGDRCPLFCITEKPYYLILFYKKKLRLFVIAEPICRASTNTNMETFRLSCLRWLARACCRPDRVGFSADQRSLWETLGRWAWFTRLALEFASLYRAITCVLTTY